MRNRYILAVDGCWAAGVILLALGLRFDWSFDLADPAVWRLMALACIVKPAVFHLAGLYRQYWPSAGARELGVVASANLVASLALLAGLLVGDRGDLFGGLPASVVIIDFFIFVASSVGLRLAVRLAGESQDRERRTVRPATDVTRRVLVAGAGEAGTMVAREIERNPQLNLTIAGFLDDDPNKIGKEIAGRPVLGDLTALEVIRPATCTDEVIIAMPTAPGHVIRRLVEACRRLQVPSKTVPGVFELLTDEVTVGGLRDVQIADLLRRHPVKISDRAPAYVADEVVLVTGAGGSIGSELSRQLAAARPRALVLLGHGENSIFDIATELESSFPGLRIEPVVADIRDGARVREVFQRHQPTVVFHAAAHKHVPLMESHPIEAVTNNIVGTARIVDAAVRNGVDRLVYISSDKAVQPSSVMGASKRLAEMVVQTAARVHRRAFVTVRFGNVLGSRGSVVPLFQRQIATGGPVTVTDPRVCRFFMTIPEAVHLVLQAGGLETRGEVFVLNMGEPVPIVELARDLIRLSGLDPDDIPIRFTGLRPGEKLTEALWEPDAEVSLTRHTDVLRVVEPVDADMEAMMGTLFATVAATDWAPASVVEDVQAVCAAVVDGAAAAPLSARRRAV